MNSYNIELGLSLLGCFVAGSGTLYLYSAYAPQVALQLRMSTTSSSLVGMIGNLGMAGTGPLAGAVVDRRGPTLPLILGGAFIFCGYTIVRLAYSSGAASVMLLATAMAMVGIGSTFSFSAIVKCAALNFPRSRGLATSVPMASFGLSAFFISSISTIFYDDIYGLLKLLCILPISMFILTGYFIRVLPSKYISVNRGSVELRELDHKPYERLHDLRQHHHYMNEPVDNENIHGTQLLRNPNFWSHFFIMGLLGGVGQMYIYSCGYCVRALSFGNENVNVQHIQSLQVGIISLSSFTGRIVSGALSDFIHGKYGMQRAWLLVLAGLLSLTAQLYGQHINDVSRVWILSTIIGLAYGTCYGSYPTIVGDLFGMKYFSQNWGLLALSPVPASYFFNMVFGRYYDLHSVADNDVRICTQGRDCYLEAFELSCMAAVVVNVLILITLRRNNKGSV